MIELRWLNYEEPCEYHDGIPLAVRKEKKLQYRILKGRIDAGGAINVLPGPEWTDWIDTPEIEE